MALPTRASETAHLQVMNRISPPISRLDHLAELSQKQLNARPSARHSPPEACNSFKNLTVSLRPETRPAPAQRAAVAARDDAVGSVTAAASRDCRLGRAVALRGGGSRQPRREVLTARTLTLLASSTSSNGGMLRETRI